MAVALRRAAAGAARAAPGRGPADPDLKTEGRIGADPRAVAPPPQRRSRSDSEAGRGRPLGDLSRRRRPFKGLPGQRRPNPDDDDAAAAAAAFTWGRDPVLF